MEGVYTGKGAVWFLPPEEYLNSCLSTLTLNPLLKNKSIPRVYSLVDALRDTTSVPSPSN